MPPPIVQVPFPTDNGESVVPYLQAHGYTPRVGAFRSSDIDTYFTDPFEYYLACRMGFKKGLYSSNALSMGTWLHKCQELGFYHDKIDPTNPPPGLIRPYLDEIEKVQRESKIYCDTFGVSFQKQAAIHADIKKDAMTALVWYHSALDCPIASYGTARQFFQKYKVVGRELRLVWWEPGRRIPMIVRVDVLLYDEARNRLWILDLKSCSESPFIRLTTCPLETQTRLYRHVVQRLLDAGEIHKLYPWLPSDVKLEGVIHWALQKPTIKFGQEDRPYTVEAKVLKSGPRKGQTVMEKKYNGDPDWDNYLKRVRDWYLGTGDFAHLAQERKGSNVGPPSDISFTSFADVPLGDKRFLLMLDEYEQAATCSAVPDNFRINAKNLREHGKLSVYAPFYLTPPREWPRILRTEGFRQDWRDTDIAATQIVKEK